MVTGKIETTTVETVRLVIAQQDDGTVLTYYPAQYLNAVETHHREYHQKQRSENVGLRDEINDLKDLAERWEKSSNSWHSQFKALQAEFDEYKRTHKARTNKEK